MQRNAWALVATLATITACAPEAPPIDARSALAKAPVLQRAFDTTVTGPVSSVFVTYTAAAPVDRVHQAMLPGVRFVTNTQRRQRLAMDVADSALQRVVAELGRLAWVTSITVTGHNPARLQGAFRPRAFAPGRMAIRRSEAIPWGVHFTNADRVHGAPFSNTGSGVKVGVMDGGIDCANTDFGTIHGVNYPTDGYGYCNDPQTHGTGVAGIIAAIANGSEVVGMAPGARLFSIRIFDHGGITTDAIVEDGINFAIDSGIQVLNWSWGDCGPRSRTLPAQVIDDVADAIEAGIVVAAAAGNGSHTGGMGCLSTDSISNYAAQPGVIAVSAVNADSTSPSGFQYGSGIWLAAPTNVESDSAGTTIASFTGTSAATPHVAGAAALLVYQGKTAGQIKTILSYETQTKPDTALLAHNNHVGYGTLDVAAAIEPTPEIWSFTITSACNPHATHGSTCTLKPTLGISGYSPVTYTWTHSVTAGSISVSESDSVFTFTAGGDTSITYYVHLKAWPHDTVTARHPRTGLEEDYTVLVCHGGVLQMLAGPGFPRQSVSRAQPFATSLNFLLRPLPLPPTPVTAAQSPRASMAPPPLACG